MTQANYQTLLETKRAVAHNAGIEIDPALINGRLFPFQRDLVRWALRKGRCALFADTGLGKTAMQVEWARLLGGRTLIIAPLSVALQTVKEAHELLGVDVHYTRSGGDLVDGINITNYEMIEHFDPAAFNGVVLDESSILKSLDGKTRRLLTAMFGDTPYRLCATATPAPNDITEIGRHAEFLGVMKNEEMLAAFFINDMKMKDGTYRLKKHAHNKFYEWMASWAIAVKRPSDIGYSDDGYILPAMHVKVLEVDADYTPEGMLPGFNVGAISAIEAKRVRKGTISERVVVCQEMTANDAQWVIWCGLNDEADALNDAIPGSVNVYGGMSPEQKADAIMAFVDGKTRVLITKTSIAGFGINMQNCHNMIFCGIDYSWESYYQAIRRCWRFGQRHEVNVHVVTSTQESEIFEKVIKKEKEASRMADELVKRSAQYAIAELNQFEYKEWEYTVDTTEQQDWTMWLGDSCERINEIPDESVDLSVFSPPFISLYTYTPTERDMGNSRDNDTFFAQFKIIIDGLLRITKPGRNCCVHVQQVAATKVNDGYIGIKDFRGDVIRAFNAQGWVLHGEVTIDKDPQVQAIRTKTKGLMFAQLHKDSAANRPAFADYMLIFQKPGENQVVVKPDVSNEEWIQWARPVWYDIKESDVLNTLVAKSNEDERHICPLQLPVIDRCVRLWSNPGELVFSPFAGIGSEGYQAVLRGRRFLGIELKPEYYNVACHNLENAARQGTNDLFSWAAANAQEA